MEERKRESGMLNQQYIADGSTPDRSRSSANGLRQKCGHFFMHYFDPTMSRLFRAGQIACVLYQLGVQHTTLGRRVASKDNRKEEKKLRRIF